MITVSYFKITDKGTKQAEERIRWRRQMTIACLIERFGLIGFDEPAYVTVQEHGSEYEVVVKRSEYTTASIPNNARVSFKPYLAGG